MSGSGARVRQRRVSSGVLGFGSSAASGILPVVHLDFVKNLYYVSQSGSAGVVSVPFSDALTFTGAAGRTYTGPEGQTLTADLNEPRVGNYINTGSGLFNAGLLIDSDEPETM